MAQLFDFSREGEPVYKEEQELSLPLSARVQRLWATRDFAQLTEANAAAGPSTLADEADAEADDKKPGELSSDELKRLKESLLLKLGAAGSELEKTLDLLNTVVPFDLAPSAPAPSLPLGRAGESLQLSALGKGALPGPTLPAAAYDASLSLATKSTAISKAALALSSASTRLQATARSAARDWNVFAQWKRDGWTIQARGSGPAASLSSHRGLEQCAKEVVALVACEESPAPLRANVAFLKKDQELGMLQRKHGKRRLLIRFTQAGEPEQVCIAREVGEDLMDQEALELFEEDLFGEISKEAQRHLPSAAGAEERLFLGRVSQHSVGAELSAGGFLTMEMVSRDALPSQSTSGHAQMASALLRLRMATMMQHRRRASASPSSNVKAPSVLLWTVDLLSSVLNIVQLRQLLPSSKLFMPAITTAAMSGLTGQELATAASKQSSIKNPHDLDALLQGCLTTDRGISINWSGADMWMQTTRGKVALHGPAQVQADARAAR